MKVLKKREILEHLNGANDLTMKSAAELSALRLSVVGVSYGQNGKNAALLEERNTGAEFVIPSRCMLLFRYI